jgi:hypothetical protein
MLSLIIDSFFTSENTLFLLFFIKVSQFQLQSIYIKLFQIYLLKLNSSLRYTSEHFVGN